MLHVRIAWWWAAVLNSSVMPTSSMTTDIQKTVTFRCWKWFGEARPADGEIKKVTNGNFFDPGLVGSQDVQYTCNA